MPEKKTAHYKIITDNHCDECGYIMVKEVTSEETSAEEQPEILFRDYLRTHPDDAKAYEALKLSMWKPYEHNRDGYTNAKTDFVQAILDKARENHK